MPRSGRLLSVTQRPIRAKLIFNAASGRSEESPQRLAEILTAMQDRQILPEVFIVRPDSRVTAVVKDAVRRGIHLIVVAGGDGTIDGVAGAMVGSRATLGIIPTGTRNNVAFSLGIPAAVPEAVGLLRAGRRLKIDVGHVHSGRSRRWFLEAASVGLLSDLFVGADNVQHGDLGQIGELLSTFAAATPSHLNVIYDRLHRLDTTAHMALIANMPYLGPRFQVDASVSADDGLLDIFVFSDLGKLDLLSYAVQLTGGPVDDARIQHLRVRHLTIASDPQMPVMVDGFMLDPGPVTIRVRARSLAVMAGAARAEMPDAPPALASAVAAGG